MKKTLTLALLLIVAFHCSTWAQVQIQKPDWDQLEASINEKKSLLETEQQIKLIKIQALQSGNDVTTARCLYNLMRIRDQRTEDTLYFKNSAFLDTLLARPARPALKAMLHLMRAQRISGYAYGDGFSYYRSVRDVGLDLFFEQIPKGISVINYELTVAHSGEFKAGPVRLTCMYQPNINAYSRTQIIKVNWNISCKELIDCLFGLKNQDCLQC